jgi:hypothetical protein
MKHMKVGAGILLVLFFAGAGATGSPQDAPRKPSVSASIDGAVTSISGYNMKYQTPVCDDGVFLRRVMLDLVAYPPSLQQVTEFIANTDPNKRVAKIEELINSDDFADYWSRLFAEVYFGDYHNVQMDTMPKLSKGGSARIVGDFIKWFKLKLQKDRPYTEIVAEMLDARGSDEGDPALAYKLSFYNGEGHAVEFANGAARTLLGIRLVCARCHDHPFDKWTVHDYYGLAAFIVRERARGRGASGEKDASDHVDVKYAEEGEMMIPNEEKGGGKKNVAVNLATGGQAAPNFLFGGSAGKNDDRMKALATFMTNKGNTQLPRALANRVWGWMFGRGVVHPVDDFNLRNKALSPALLEVLTRDLIDNKYSIKQLVRGIANSNAYQRSTESDQTYMKIDFSRGTVKQLNGEQLMNSIAVATNGQPRKDISHVLQVVVSLFPAGAIWTETTTLPGNARQALLLRNGSEISSAASGSILSGVKNGKGSDEDKVDEMFLAALSRKATDSEKKRYVAFIKGHGSGWEDAYWTILNTSEFVTRH